MKAFHSDSVEALLLYHCFNWLIFSTGRMEKSILKMKRRRRTKNRRRRGRRRREKRKKRKGKKRKMGRRIVRMTKVRKSLLLKMRRMLLQTTTLILNLTLRVKKKLQEIKKRRKTRQLEMSHRIWRDWIQKWKLPKQSFLTHLLVSKGQTQRSLLFLGSL